MTMSDLQHRIEYIIEGDDDAESKAEKKNWKKIKIQKVILTLTQ